MKQIVKLKICDWSLIPISIVMLASGIQLEALSGEGMLWIYVHICIGVVFTTLCGWHIWLHFKWNNWFERFHKMKSQVTRILWWIALITFLTGIAATIQWFAHSVHTSLGGIHGKLGFLMILLIIAHALKRRKFYQPKR